MPSYDAFLLVSFGGPEGPADVMPFLQNVTRGRRIPRERLAAVAEHYYAFGGVSPINRQCRDLLAAIGKDFAAAGLNLPVYWGNRNWHPLLGDTVAAMAADGVRPALAFVTSAYAPAAVLVPVGFVSDHMEVRHDLDVQAAETAARLGLPLERAATPGTDHRFVSMITDLVRERLDRAPRAALGRLGPGCDACP